MPLYGGFRGGFQVSRTRKEQREQEKETNYFFEFTKIQRHFFKDMNEKLKKVNDPRHQSYITYDCDMLLWMLLLKNACDMKSMRSMSRQLNKDECIVNLQKVLGIKDLEELPHYDTVNDFLAELEPTEMEKIRTYMIRELLKKRCFEEYRIKGRYWGVIFDGTGLYSFDEKHCEHCLRREYTDEESGDKHTIYMHHVLEAKLVIGDMVLSIGSEFIENESENVSKQDCELKAFYRLAKRLKQTYKRLPICILGDSLYACQGVFDVCEQQKWMYMMRFKEGRIASLAGEYKVLKEMKPTRSNQEICWVNNISYHEYQVNMLEYEEAKHKKKFLFVTNIQITEHNAKGLVAAGRSRWKIENEGFQRQKKQRYHIEHVNSHSYNAMKNHYLLTQIVDIWMQLYEQGLGMIKAIKRSLKEISSNLLETVRTRILTDADILHLDQKIQVRFT